MTEVTRFEGVIAGIVFLMISLFIAGSAFGSDGAPAVGMNSGDVQTVWGDPEERIAYETKREELWKYTGSEVRFREGRVIAWRYLDERVADGAGDGNSNDIDGDVDGKEVAVADILTEIMKEMPGETQ